MAISGEARRLINKTIEFYFDRMAEINEMAAQCIRNSSGLVYASYSDEELVGMLKTGDDSDRLVVVIDALSSRIRYDNIRDACLDILRETDNQIVAIKLIEILRPCLGYDHIRDAFLDILRKSEDKMVKINLAYALKSKLGYNHVWQVYLEVLEKSNDDDLTMALVQCLQVAKGYSAVSNAIRKKLGE